MLLASDVQFSFCVATTHCDLIGLICSSLCIMAVKWEWDSPIQAGPPYFLMWTHAKIHDWEISTSDFGSAIAIGIIYMFYCKNSI